MFLSEFRRIDREGILRSRASHDEEIGYASYGREGLSEFCLSIEPEIWLSDTWIIRCESHPEDFSHEGRLWSDCEVDSLRESDRGYFFIDSLTIDIHGTSPVELHIHHRESSCWTRSHRFDWCYSAECAFEWESHDLLDIFSTHPLCFCKNGNTRTIEVWEDIDRQFRETIYPEYTDNEIEKQYKDSPIESKFYKTIEHIDYGLVDKIALTSISSFHLGWEASVTIWVSALSPSVTIYFSPMSS